MMERKLWGTRLLPTPVVFGGGEKKGDRARFGESIETSERKSGSEPLIVWSVQTHRGLPGGYGASGNHRATGQSQFPPRYEHLALHCLICMDHPHTKYQRQSSFKSLKNTKISYCCLRTLVPAEKTEPLECAHTVQYTHLQGSSTEQDRRGG